MTETDRELLELAAKSYGPEIEWDGDGWVITSKVKGHLTNYEAWNPLIDDGDALRLTVKLGIEPKKPSRARSVGTVVQAWYPPDGNPNRSACAHVSEHVRNGDRLEATRRAIVRAAAEIGRIMS
ncbi:hypothetical protein JAO85_13955 [Comamonas sp. NyZ500]|uniref:hypothetical protein n=1 Tax=Comamonas sp. NyZ500 TaxID=2795732 RepID=UPI00192C5103|nr:hypothetical protein [Comamonas sp. NyZ500]MBL5978389.1 hypothetical protein [Comamonas sp. NyZ500]